MKQMSKKYPRWIYLLAHQLGIDASHAKGYYDYDFKDDEKPDFNSLKDHIAYQERLSAIGHACNWDEHAFADMWCQEF